MSPARPKPSSRAPATTRAEDLGVDRRVPDDALLADVLRTGLELRLDERDEGPFARDGLEGREDLEHGDERNVHGHDVRELGKVGGGERPGVLLDGHDPGVLAEPPVELLRVDVDGVNPCGASF